MPAYVRYGIAVAWPLNAPSSCFILAIMVSGLYGGRGPSLMTVVLSSLAFAYAFLPPQFHFSVEPSADLRFLAFVGAALVALGGD